MFHSETLKQLARKLKLAVGQRTEITVNVRIDNGLTNGASNVIKLIQITLESKPTGLVWVQFDHEDVGKKKRNKKTEISMLDPFKIPGHHQLNLVQPNVQWVGLNQPKL